MTSALHEPSAFGCGQPLCRVRIEVLLLSLWMDACPDPGQIWPCARCCAAMADALDAATTREAIARAITGPIP